MPMATYTSHSDGHEACTDHVIGAILSGWRYDISGTPAGLRGDYENHLRGCAHCRGRQRLHRTVDLLLLAVTTLSFAAFLLAALVMRRLEAARHLAGNVHVRLPADHAMALAHIPASVTISLEAVAIAGVIVSMLLWMLVAMATPVPAYLAEMLKDHLSPELRDRLWKQAA
ncbi:MAG TPA: hypothetical protein VM865_07885 [Acidobacteriaceae bacterium]|nr:hypothetical protein [Acidobacteriaceae bacterium]